MLKKLPIGIQTFAKVIEGNYIYTDKTAEALEMINTYQNVFLSRPRRFGKSLFLDTLKNIFEGNRELFEGLHIYDNWDWDVKYPVIKISFSGDLRSREGLKRNLLHTLKSNQKRLGVECEKTDEVDTCFKELIEKTHEKYNQQVVVLIDEYDKAILDNLDQMEVARENRELIKGFYTILKDSDAYLRFAFLTGVSKFSRASIFSGLNMLTDISLNKRFGNVCGYTQRDIESIFIEHLDGVDLEKLKVWYNGYNFLKDDVYNPFDILQFIANDHMFENYWFVTGTPTFLIKLIEKNNYFLPKLADITVGKELLDSFDIDNINLEVILYQSGYLTIESVKEKRRGGFEYKLKLPNKEVKQSFNSIIIDFLTQEVTQKADKQDALYDALADGDLELLESSIKSIFASIPYNNFTKNDIQNYEGFYASVMYVYFQSLGIEIIGEDVTNHGRIDLTLFVEDTIYIVEFKLSNNNNNALQQIQERDYAQKYLSHKKKIILVGIEFDRDERNICGFEYEVLHS